MQGLQEVFSAIFPEAMKSVVKRVQRLEYIRAAAKGEPRLTQANIDGVLSDFEIVLGSRIGTLDQRLAGFFIDIKNNGLFRELVISALTQADNPALSLALCQALKEHFPKDHISIDQQIVSSSSFIKRLHEMAIRSLRARLGNDVDFVAASIEIKTASRRFFSNINSKLKYIKDMAEYERALRARENPDSQTERSKQDGEVQVLQPPICPTWLSLSFQEIESGVEAISTATKINFSSVWIVGPNDKSHPVSLNGMMVPPKLKAISRAALNASSVISRTDIDSLQEELNFEFIKNKRYVVVLGDPGGGKSTLGQKLCLTLCESVAEQKILPIRVILREYESYAAKIGRAQFLDFICDDIVEKAPALTNELVRPIIENCLQMGRAFVFFDGIDEIVETTRRKDVVSLINAFVSAFPTSKYLFTSRIVGYSEASLPSEYAHFQLLGLTSESGRQLAKNMLVNVFDVTPQDAEVQAIDVYTQAVREAKDLVENPLLLGLLTWLYKERRGTLPDNRAKIYRECSELLFKRWDKERKLKFDIGDDIEILHLLPELANLFYLDSRFQGGVVKSVLEAEIKNYYEKQLSANTRQKALAIASSVVKFITGRAWVLTDKGADKYDFNHRTFLEYFFSRYLNDKSASITELFEIIRPHILAAEWNVPCHLALQAKVESGIGACNLASHYLAETVVEADRLKLIAPVEFAIEAVRYILMSEDSALHLGRSIGDCILSVPDAGQSVLDSLTDLMQSQGIRSASVFAGIIGKFSVRVSEYKNEIAISAAADFIKREIVVEGLTKKSTRLYPPCFRDANIESEISAFAAACKNLGRNQVYMLKRAFDLGAAIDAEECTTLGERFWGSTILQDRSIDWRIFDLSFGLSQLFDVWADAGLLPESRYAQICLAVRQSLRLEQKPTGRLASFDIGVWEWLVPASPIGIEPKLEIAEAIFATVNYLGKLESMRGLDRHAFPPYKSGAVRFAIEFVSLSKSPLRFDAKEFLDGLK